MQTIKDILLLLFSNRFVYFCIKSIFFIQIPTTNLIILKRQQKIRKEKLRFRWQYSRTIRYILSFWPLRQHN